MAEGLAMSAKRKQAALPSLGQPLKVGDRVRIRHYGGQHGQIVEDRGLLGPEGARIYRVLLARPPRNESIELREDQLERISSDGQ
jgi:hypothetical protein